VEGGGTSEAVPEAREKIPIWCVVNGNDGACLTANQASECLTTSGHLVLSTRYSVLITHHSPTRNNRSRRPQAVAIANNSAGT
jgi:hypothetical protein